MVVFFPFSGDDAKVRPRWVIMLPLLAALFLLVESGRRIQRRVTLDPTPLDALPSSFGPPAPGGRTLTITFWNVEWFPGRKPKAGERAKASHVAAVVPVVERLDPDVLGLEEVADADGAHLIADHLKGFRVDVCTEFTRAPTDEPTRQQIVLCSRLPLLESGWEKWRPTADGLVPRRGFAFAAYQPNPGEILLVYGLHLKSNFLDEPGGEVTNFAMREEAARQLLVHQRAAAARLAQAGRVRLAVVGGDMNTSLDDARFASEQTLRLWLGEGGFRWGWDGVPLERRFTLPGMGRYPAVCFDHVFYHGNGGVRLLDCAVEFTNHTASDHRPMTARFAW